MLISQAKRPSGIMRNFSQEQTLLNDMINRKEFFARCEWLLHEYHLKLSCLTLIQTKKHSISHPKQTPWTKIYFRYFKLYKKSFVEPTLMPKNITNGQFIINYNEEDRVEQHYKFIRAPNTDSLDILKHQNSKTPTNYYVENIRTGEFTQISENYMLESAKQKSDEPVFTTNSFETQMKILFLSLQEKMNKGTTFFQGIFVGMALLYTITLNLSGSVSSDLVRVEDQAIRIVSILSSFGSIYSFLIANQRYSFIKLRGLSAQIDIAYKSLALCTVEMVFYTVSYIIYNVSHTYAVKYNISASNYSELSQTTTAYTVLCIIGWIITNINTYKYGNQ